MASADATERDARISSVPAHGAPRVPHGQHKHKPHGKPTAKLKVHGPRWQRYILTCSTKFCSAASVSDSTRAATAAAAALRLASATAASSEITTRVKLPDVGRSQVSSEVRSGNEGQPGFTLSNSQRLDKLRGGEARYAIHGEHNVAYRHLRRVNRIPRDSARGG